MRNWFLSVLLSLVLIGAATGCAPQATAPAEATGATVTLKITALPILDTLPILVAQGKGLFEKHGVKVEFVPAASAPERDQLIAAGQADGMINEVLSAMFFNKDGVQLQVVRYARAASSGTALFTLLANSASGVTSPADLAGKSIGISEGTVIAYVTERMLVAEGVDLASVKLVSVPKIDARLALLQSGELDAAVLPEPLARVAVKDGALAVLADTSHPDYSFSTYSFRKAVLDQNPQAVERFLIAIEEATDLINADPNQWKQILVDNKILPPPLVESFAVPQFVKAGVPTEAQYADALAWAREKGYLTLDIPYADCVTADYLP